MAPTTGKGKRAGGMAKKKYHKKYTFSTHARVGRKDIDQVYDDIEKIKSENMLAEIGSLPTPKIPFDEELPGGGQFYCIETARHFTTLEALENHKRSKVYKRRVKQLSNEKKYTQEDADLAAGLGKEKLGPAHKSKINNNTTMMMTE